MKGALTKNKMEGNQEELRELEKHSAAEKADNELEFSRQLGKPVRYGQVVQLRHALTKMFVCANSVNAARLDTLNMGALMNPENSKRLFTLHSLASDLPLTTFSLSLSLECLFKIIPRFKVRAEGDFVHIQEQVIFENAKVRVSLPSGFNPLTCSPSFFPLINPLHTHTLICIYSWPPVSSTVLTTCSGLDPKRAFMR